MAGVANKYRVNVDLLLDRYDKTDPVLQRRIVAKFCALATVYGEALDKISKMNDGDAEQLAAELARETLSTQIELV